MRREWGLWRWYTNNNFIFMEVIQNRTERMMRLLMMLSGNRRFTMQELVNRLGRSARNVRRDLSLIEASGFLLERENGYRLLADRTANRDLKNLLHFTQEEVAILYQTLLLIEGDSAVKERLMRKMNTFYDLKALEQLRQRDDLTKVRIIRTSMEQRMQLIIRDYRSSNSNSIEDRRVEAFDFMPDYHAVWCYEIKSHSCKQFKIARMQAVELSTSRWQYQEKHQKPFTDVFRISAARPLHTVTMRLSLKACNLLIEEFPAAREHIVTEGNTYHLKVPVAGYEGIGRFVLGLMEEVERIEPAAFRNYLKKRIKNIEKRTESDRGRQ